MPPLQVVRENWLSKKPRHNGWTLMIAFGVMLYFTNIAFFNGWADWLPATPKSVYMDGQYWRAWSALFAHADLGHFLSNVILFLPLTYLLTSYYGYTFFPLAGLFFGGITNFFVLKTMPLETSLLGISGVVYWMGAAWLTLFAIIDRRKSIRKRFAVAACLTVILFIPETYKPEVSHLSHFIGFLFGMACAAGYYLIYRQKIEADEVKEFIAEDDETLEAP